MHWLAQLMRRRALHPVWERLHRMSLIGMNYWSSELFATGELDALRYIAQRLDKVARPVVFDVGANVGSYSVACLRAFQNRCQLHAFEPSGATFGKLRSNSALSGDGVYLHQCAMSDHDGTAILHTSEAGSSIASLEQLDRPVRPFDRRLDETVELRTLDGFCLDEGIDEIDLLKLDIEGHELSALRGAKGMVRDGKIRFLQFEFGENNVSSRTYLADFNKILGDRFNLFRIVPGGPLPWRYQGSRSEIFATMNYLAERK
ncbi:MAG TPA: FkbM family methyltransferase [Sphingomicrobium sp.]